MSEAFDLPGLPPARRGDPRPAPEHRLWAVPATGDPAALPAVSGPVATDARVGVAHD
jgi:hypothetical protein